MRCFNRGTHQLILVRLRTWDREGGHKIASSRKGTFGLMEIYKKRGACRLLGVGWQWGVESLVRRRPREGCTTTYVGGSGPKVRYRDQQFKGETSEGE